MILLLAVALAGPAVAAPVPPVAPASAVTAPAPISAPPAPPGPADTVVIPAETPVVLALAEEVSSRHAKPLQHFALRLAEPILVGGRIVVPAGAPAEGEVIHAGRAGTKPGELILAARSIDAGAVRIPLHKGHFSNSGASSAMVIAGPGFVSYSTSGKNIKLPVGFRLPALVAAATPVPVPPVAP